MIVVSKVPVDVDHEKWHRRHRLAAERGIGRRRGTNWKAFMILNIEINGWFRLVAAAPPDNGKNFPRLKNASFMSVNEAEWSEN